MTDTQQVVAYLRDGPTTGLPTSLVFLGFSTWENGRAAKAIRIGLERGDIVLGHEMQLCVKDRRA